MEGSCFGLSNLFRLKIKLFPFFQKLLKGRTEDAFQITRHGADRKTEEAREWIEATTKGRDDRKIWILDPTVG